MKRSPERLEFLRDVLGAFISSSSENPVCDVRRIEYVRDGNYYTSVDVKYDDEPDSDAWHKVDVETIARAFGLIARNEVPDVSDKWRASVLESRRQNDAGEIDGPRASNIIEIGVFGRLVYIW